MSNEENNEDILKKLRDVRRKLQESLSEDGTTKGEEPKVDTSKILVEGQAEIEKQDKAKEIEAKSEALKKPKLYKAGEAPTKQVAPKKLKQAPTKTGLSAKKMAGIQKRIQSKVAERQSMSKKKKAMLVIAMVVAAAPLLFVTTLSMVTCEFNIDNLTFGFSTSERDDDLTTISLFIPVHNPGLLPATIGSIKLELWAGNGTPGIEKNVGAVLFYDSITIMPKGSTNLGLAIALNQEAAGEWLTDMLQKWELSLTIKNFEYNGLRFPGEISIPPMSLTSLLELVLGLFGMDLDTIFTDLLGELGGLFSMPDASKMSDATAQKFFLATGQNPKTGAYDPIRQALYKQKMEGKSQKNALLSSQDIDLDKLFLNITEEFDKFMINLSLPFALEAIEGFDLGTIKIWDLNITLNVDTGNGLYDYPLLKILSCPSNRSDGFTQSGNYQIPNMADIQIAFGGPADSSEANVYIELVKDTGYVGEHPSAYVNWNDPNEVDTFFNITSKQQYPLWHFLYNLLFNMQLDCKLFINGLSLEVFGMAIHEISIPTDFLPPLTLDLNDLLQELFGTLDLSSLLSGLFTAPIFTPMGALGMVAQMAVTGGLIFPKYLNSLTPTTYENTPEGSRVLDIANLDLEEIIDLSSLDLDAILGSIQEVIGTPDARLSLSIPLTIKSFPIDLSLGLSGTRLSLSGVLDDIPREFAVATLGGNGSDTFYFNGWNSSETIVLNLTLYTNASCAPYVEHFLRRLIEDYTIDATINLEFKEMLLFAQNYTLPKLNLTLPLVLDLGSMVEELGDLIGDLLGPDMIVDLLGGLGLNANADIIQLSGNPLTVAQEVALGVALKNPVMQYLTTPEGRQWVASGGQSNLQSSAIQKPDAAQDFSLEVRKLMDKWQINVVLGGLDLGDITSMIPITLGVGYARLDMYGKNQYNDWAKMMSLRINNYFMLSGTIDIALTIEIYNDGPLCNFLSKLLDEGKMDLKLNGLITLSLSGVYIPDLKMGISMEDLDLGMNLSSIITTLVDSLSGTGEEEGEGQQAYEIIGQQNLVKQSDPVWWSGDQSKIPFVSQDISDYLEIGSFNIYELSETGWPYVDQGKVTVSVGVEITNKLMDLAITQLALDLYTEDPMEPSSVKLMSISSNGVNLIAGIRAELRITITLYKSQDLEDWLSNILATFGLTGWATANISIQVFGCTIGPIELSPENALNLGALIPDLTDLLTMLLESPIPFAHKEAASYYNGPQPSQDMTDIIGQFAPMYVVMRPDDYNPNAGPQNWVTPMMDVRAGICLMPNFNISLTDTYISLHDANIYNAIYDETEQNYAEAQHYSLMANVSFVPDGVYCNNTYSNPSDPYNQTIDPDKPWYVAGSEPGTGTIYYQNPNDPSAKAYHLGTYFQFEASVKVYNISYGSYETRYPRHLWKRLGGPYFPVRVFGPEFGGYPDHRVEYHPYFSPAYNILNGLLNGIDLTNLSDLGSLDIGGLLSGLKLAGQIHINVFSMDLVLDLGSDVIANLMSSVLGMLSLGVKQMVKTTVNPFGMDLLPAFEDENGNPVAMSNEPRVPDASASMAIDIFSFLTGVKLGCMLERFDHEFCPQYGWGGTNVNPWTAGYKAGIYDPVRNPYASNVENFYKDPYYDDFKILTENYRNSLKMSTNPYFEVYDENGNYISDPDDWALKWRGNSGRTRTTDMTIIVALGMRIPIGILAGYMPVWIDGEMPCTIQPFGYFWINNSVMITPVEEDDPAWVNWMDGGSLFDDNGKPPSPGIYLTIELRGFEGSGFKSFFNELLDQFDVRLIIGGVVNISLFGYEIYNLEFPALSMGEPSSFIQRCEEYNAMHGGGGYIYDQPTTEGGLPPVPPEEPPEIPPEEFIPEYAEFDIMDVINLNALIDGLLGGGDIGSILNLVFSTITIAGISGEGIRLRTNPLEVVAALAAVAWLENIYIGLTKVQGPQYSDWKTAPDFDRVNVGTIVSDQWIELASYAGSGIDPRTNPSKFLVNTLQDLDFHMTWTLQLDIYIKWELLGGIDIIGLVIALISGDDQAMADALGGHLWLILNPLIVNIGLPLEFDYHTPIIVNPDDLAFDLVDMIAGGGSLF